MFSAYFYRLRFIIFSGRNNIYMSLRALALAMTKDADKVKLHLHIASFIV